MRNVRNLLVLFFSVVLLLFFSILLPFRGVNRISVSAADTQFDGELPRPIHYENKVIVLTYHHIDKEEKDFTITQAHFERDLKTLKENRYHVISMEKYLQWVRTGETIPNNAVVITFDDGYESFYTYAYPLLKKYGFTATDFVVVGKSDSLDSKAIRFLTWDEMREMKRNGMSFFNHTYDSHYLQYTTDNGNPKAVLANPIFLKGKNRVETAEEYKSRVKADLALAEKRLNEELGEQPKLLAFPYGEYNDSVIEIGRELGIELFFTTEEGINSRKTNLVKRINVGSATVTPNVKFKKFKRYEQNS